MNNLKFLEYKKINILSSIIQQKKISGTEICKSFLTCSLMIAPS